MITRHHETEASRSTAVYSDCETYRYRLTRHWGDRGSLAFIMLNPSTADERRNDPTIARCEGRARALGFGAVDIVNLFALRATRPEDLKKAQDPEGVDNMNFLRDTAASATCLVAAWGVHGTYRGQDMRVCDVLEAYPLHALGITKDGHPRHPLYVRKTARLGPWHPKSR